MTRQRALLVHCLSAALLLSFTPSAVATHHDQGTVKVHENEEETPDERNVPHVGCDLWVEGFDLGDDSGWLLFFAWPPTGDFEMVDSGEEQNWTADEGATSGEFHFLAGPFTLDTGRYRVEVYTDDGHPGSDEGHFAKSKEFWVACEEVPVVNPPCPVILDVEAASDDGAATITLTWSPAVGADGYIIYRAVDGGDFESIDGTDETSYVDDDVTPGVSYEYYVTAVIGNTGSEECEIVEATAIPFYPNAAIGALALVGLLGAFVMLRRKL